VREREVIDMGETMSACPLTRGQRILVALDGSVHSAKALDQALSLGKVCKSKLFLMSVVDLYAEVLEEAPALVETMSAEVRAILEQGKEKAEKEGIDCETIAHIGGKIHEFILAEAKEKNVDLIAMGTHGRTGLKGLFIGSVAQRVIGHAPCAVLVTPV
jgi:nucleotide-binding universal stress UspA family protein